MWWKLFRDSTEAGMEAQRVIALRLLKLSKGDAAARKEAQTMIDEKITAAIDAAAILARGGSMSSVLRRYRTIMRANTRRLSGKSRKRR